MIDILISTLFCYKQEYITFIRTGRHFGCVKKQLKYGSWVLAIVQQKLSQLKGKQANSENLCPPAIKNLPNKSIDETEECSPKMHSSGRVMLVKE